MKNRRLLFVVSLGAYMSMAAMSSSSPLKVGSDSLGLSKRPAYVNNAESIFFPSVFNQDGGSCGSASRIGYMFTHEINAFRGADASKPENVYPTHFTWLLTNSHSGKEGMAMANGIPNSIEYGGATYSRVFGNQDCADADFGWMQGYDKWYRAMFNRISTNSFSPYGVDTEQGREFVKNWLWNHQGDDDFHIGGICGIGVASACKQAPIGDDPEGRNKAAGVVGAKYVTRWGDGVDHALTIVGYDDRIVFDLDSNKVYGEKDKDECGAWIIVNSWGDGWANNGFIYCPYKYGFPVRQNEGGAWKPEFYHVRKNYRPLRTLKVRMDYSHRSEIKLMAGISTNLNATKPDIFIELEHFKFAGDGRSSNAKKGKEAPTPMLGKWADGKLHSEPMEFGYDLTDLSAGFDIRQPLKYFFLIERKKGAEGTGRVELCSIIDYEFDREGIETPLLQESVSIQGEQTHIASAVYGEPFFPPLNLQRKSGKKTEHFLEWEQPQLSHYPVKGYILYKNNCPADTLSSGIHQVAYTDGKAHYALAAYYDWNDTLVVVSAKTPEICPDSCLMYGGEETDRKMLSISMPDTVRVGEACQASINASYCLGRVKWSAPGSNVKDCTVESPVFIFNKKGCRNIVLEVEDKQGRRTKVSHQVTVLPARELDASFEAIRSEVLAGERMSFHPLNPMPGFRYEWTMKGGDTEKALTQNAATTYANSGEYEVQLSVTDPRSGRKRMVRQPVFVKNVAPQVAFDVSPMVIQKGDVVTLKDQSRYVPTEWSWKIDSRRFTTFASGKNPELQMAYPGVYDVTLSASNEEGSNSLTREGVLTVCNADSKNGLNFSHIAAELQTEKPVWKEETEQMTVEWWMNPSSKGDVGGIGYSAETWKLQTNKHGRMTMYVDSIPVHSANDFVISGQWHHYAVVFDQGKVAFMRDGETLHTARVLDSRKQPVTQLPQTPCLRMGGADLPMQAVVDEFRIWNKALPDSLVQKYCNAPLGDIAKLEREEGLMLYYSFNQNGGDVKDLTSKGNAGVRKSFGPDGDAWGRSYGVFSLNFETPFEDLTEHYLPSAGKPFPTDGTSVNLKDSARFCGFDCEQAGWTVENYVANDSITTGMYVDRNKDNALCVYTGWDGFAPKISNHKLYRTIKLPAGKYELEVVPEAGFAAGSSRLVVSEGSGLPDMDSMEKAIHTVALTQLRLPFILSSEKEVSLGIVFDLQGRSGIAIKKILLHKAVVSKQ